MNEKKLTPTQKVKLLQQENEILLKALQYYKDWISDKQHIIQRNERICKKLESDILEIKKKNQELILFRNICFN